MLALITRTNIKDVYSVTNLDVAQHHVIKEIKEIYHNNQDLAQKEKITILVSGALPGETEIPSPDINTVFILKQA